MIDYGIYLKMCEEKWTGKKRLIGWIKIYAWNAFCYLVFIELAVRFGFLNII